MDLNGYANTYSQRSNTNGVYPTGYTPPVPPKMGTGTEQVATKLSFHQIDSETTNSPRRKL